MSTQPTPWPRAEATINPEGEAVVSVAGSTEHFNSPSVDEARQAVKDRVASYARDLGRPLLAVMQDPEGTWSLIVHGSGEVEEADDASFREYWAPSQEEANVVEKVTMPEDVRAKSTPLTVTQRIEATEPPRTRREARESFLREQKIEEPAYKGFRGALTALGIRVAPSESERHEREDIRAVSQHWAGPRTIAVVNGKGGANKTPTVAELSAVFARYGGGGVLAWDNNQTRGTLGWRTEQGPHQNTIMDLLPYTEELLGTNAQSGQLTAFIHHQTRDQYDVLRSNPLDLADSQRVLPGDVDAVHAVASKYYRIVFMDSGNDESDPTWLSMIDKADQIVVATTTAEDRAEAGRLLLEALEDRDERSAKLAHNAVTIISQAERNTPKAEVQRLVGGFEGICRAVSVIPFDPALVSGLLQFGSLAPATKRAWLAAAANVARGL